ncbi:MAG: ABC transporter permease [Dehalococcoidia bacterium]
MTVALEADAPAPSPPRGLRHAAARHPAALVAGGVLLALAALAVLAPLVAPYSPTEQLYRSEGLAVCEQYAPGLRHPFGIDALCRDSLSRFLHGARISLAIGVFTQVVIVGIGLVIGGAAGLGRPWLDNLLMRFTDATYAFPDLLLILLMASALRGSALGEWAGGTPAIFLAIGLVGWVTVARLVRGQVLSLKSREFVVAARALGASEARIFARHLLPSMLGPVIVAATFGVPSAIFAEAALSYIGIGARPPTPSWGVMVNDGYGVVLVSVWPVLFPAAGIALTMLCFTVLGDALRAALDPRARR